MVSAHYGLGEMNGSADSKTAGSQHSCSEGIPIAEIDPMFRIRSPGSNILVCEHGDVIAVFYGESSFNPYNTIEPRVAYSLNAGSTWTTYGPFGSAYRMQGAMDGPPNFCQIGGLVFIWYECTPTFFDYLLIVMHEENVPSAPSFSVPIVLPHSQSPVMYPINPDISIAQDDITKLIATAWSFGNEWAYCWTSTDGGYSWTDTIPMVHINQDGTSGCLSSGVDDYVLYAYLDYYTYSTTDSTIYPYYLESTDGGHTWSSATPVPGVPVNAGSQFWWSQFDCLVIDNEPWLVYTDLGTPGGGHYIAHGTGGPGNWTWNIWDARQLGTCSLTIADTTLYCYPVQYPNLSYDPASNTILASYKAYYYKEYAGTTYYDGAHIGGIYTTNNGNNWIITQPLSDANTSQINWNDWRATEVAYRLANVAGEVCSYGIWVNSYDQNLYFERGKVASFSPLAIDENTELSVMQDHFVVAPCISRGVVRIEFALAKTGWVEINLYDICGRLINNIHEGNVSGGHHVIDLNGADLPNGVYFVSLRTELSAATRRIVLMR